MPKISVLTPSIRPDGLAIVQESLARQTFTGFEWLTEISIPDRGHDLNTAYNRMLRRAKGELIVSYQDHTKISDDGLEQFWEAYQQSPNTFFTAPVGKVIDWDDIHSVKWDWRAYPEAEMSWQRWEIDWGAAPLSCLYAVGGFDEALDEFWSSDNVSVGWRAHLKGFSFKHLPHNKAIALDHDALTKHPFRERYNPEFNNYRMKQVEMGELTIDYLHGNPQRHQDQSA